MKKLFIIGFALITLIGCEKETTDVTTRYNIPPDLQECRIYWLSTESGKYITIARCPYSVTSATYNVGKTHESTVTIDEDTVGYGEYTRLKNKFADR